MDHLQVLAHCEVYATFAAVRPICYSPSSKVLHDFIYVIHEAPLVLSAFVEALS